MWCAPTVAARRQRDILTEWSNVTRCPLFSLTGGVKTAALRGLNLAENRYFNSTTTKIDAAFILLGSAMPLPCVPISLGCLNACKASPTVPLTSVPLHFAPYLAYIRSFIGYGLPPYRRKSAKNRKSTTSTEATIQFRTKSQPIKAPLSSQSTNSNTRGNGKLTWFKGSSGRYSYWWRQRSGDDSVIWLRT